MNFEFFENFPNFNIKTASTMGKKKKHEEEEEEEDEVVYTDTSDPEIEAEMEKADRKLLKTKKLKKIKKAATENFLSGVKVNGVVQSFNQTCKILKRYLARRSHKRQYPAYMNFRERDCLRKKAKGFFYSDTLDTLYKQYKGEFC